MPPCAAGALTNRRRHRPQRWARVLTDIDLPEAALLEVFTSNGTLILREQAAAGIKTMHLESGSYLLHITSNGNTTTKRVVVL